MWTTSHRAVVLTLVIGILVYLSIRLAMQHTYISDPQPEAGLRASELADRLNPNTATAAELAAIPNVGEKLAGAIVEYRDAFVRDHPGRPAFPRSEELLAVRGVGVGKMEAMVPYLVFPTTQATNAPMRPLAA